MTGGRARAQTHLIGVSLMVALTVLALGGLTVAIGTVVDSSANAAEADRVADGMTIVADPGDVVDTAEAELRFGDGRLQTDERTIRIRDARNDTLLEQIDSDVLVYEVGEDRVIGGNGAVLRAAGGGASMVTRPSIVADSGGDVLLLGTPAIDAPATSISTSRASRVTLRASVDHRRVDLGEREVEIAVQTEYPETWVRYFEDGPATVTDRAARFPGDDADDPDSVVATVPGQRRATLIVHETELEVLS